MNGETMCKQEVYDNQIVPVNGQHEWRYRLYNKNVRYIDALAKVRIIV